MQNDKDGKRPKAKTDQYITIYVYIYFLISQPVRDRLPAFTIHYEVNADGAAQRLENSDTGAG